MELYRLFADVIGNTGIRDDRCGSIYTLSKIAIEPIFVYKIADLPNNTDSVLNVTVNSPNGAYAASTSAIMIVCLYDQEFEIPYRDGNVEVENCRLID